MLLMLDAERHGTLLDPSTFWWGGVGSTTRGLEQDHSSGQDDHSCWGAPNATLG